MSSPVWRLSVFLVGPGVFGPGVLFGCLVWSLLFLPLGFSVNLTLHCFSGVFVQLPGRWNIRRPCVCESESLLQSVHLSGRWNIRRPCVCESVSLLQSSGLGLGGGVQVSSSGSPGEEPWAPRLANVYYRQHLCKRCGRTRRRAREPGANASPACRSAGRCPGFFLWASRGGTPDISGC